MKVLIVKLGSIGDIVHTLPALAALREGLHETKEVSCSFGVCQEAVLGPLGTLIEVRGEVNDDVVVADLLRVAFVENIEIGAA